MTTHSETPVTDKDKEPRPTEENEVGSAPEATNDDLLLPGLTLEALTLDPLPGDEVLPAPPVCKALRKQLEVLVPAGLSATELVFALDAIAKEYGRSSGDIEKLYRSLRLEADDRSNAESPLDDLEELRPDPDTNIAEWIPPQLLEGFEAVRTTTAYDLSVMLAVLLTGLTAALPLNSSIELDPVQGFSQPVSLYLLLLMPSGELKSPLIARLISKPWQQAVDPVVDQAYRNRQKDWRVKKADAKAENEEFDLPEPRPPQTLVSGDSFSTQGIDAIFATQHDWGHRGVLLELDEAAPLLRAWMKPTTTNKDAGWLLSRYDGKGSRNALATRGTKRLYDQCRLSIMAICPSPLYQEMSGDGDQSGLNARFLVVEQTQVHRTFPETYPAELIEAAQSFDALVLGMYQTVAACDALSLQLSPAAFALFQQACADIDARKRACLGDAERSLLNKSAGQIGRLAAAFHLLWLMATTPEIPQQLEPTQTVGEQALQQAISFHRLLIDQTIGVRISAAEHGTAPSIGMMLHRKTWLLPERTAKVSDLRKKAFSSKTRPSTPDVLQALEHLVSKGYGSLKRISHNGQEGRAYVAIKPLPTDA